MSPGPETRAAKRSNGYSVSFLTGLPSFSTGMRAMRSHIWACRRDADGALVVRVFYPNALSVVVIDRENGHPAVKLISVHDWGFFSGIVNTRRDPFPYRLVVTTNTGSQVIADPYSFGSGSARSISICTRKREPIARLRKDGCPSDHYERGSRNEFCRLGAKRAARQRCWRFQ